MGVVVYVQSSSNLREYVQTKLSDTLLASQVYCVSFYVNPADLLEYGCDKIGCYFSDTAITGCGNCLMSYIPQVESTSMISDTSAWVKVSGYFTAVGKEQYLTIGNFRLNANTNTTIINSSVSNQEAYFYIDDISVMLCSDTATSVKELSEEKLNFNLYPNPNNGNMLLDYTINPNDIGIIKIYDPTGKLITSYQLNVNNKQLQINNQDLNNGIYIYDIIVNNKTVKTDKLVIIKQ